MMKKLFSLLFSLLIAFAFAGEALAAEAGSPFRISCTIDGDPGSSRGFCWYTKGKSGTEIRIFENNEDITASVTVSKAECKKFKGNYMHKLVVSGLEAGKTYSYRLGDEDAMSEEGSFFTDDGDGNVTALIFADVQSRDDEQFARARKAVDAVSDELDSVDFTVNLGDFTNECNNDEWDSYAESFDTFSLNTTLVPVAGNHDGFVRYSWFSNMFCLDESESVQSLNGVNYSFDYGNIHFAVLNTNDLFAVSDAQLDWLRNDMSSTDMQWKIIAMHKSPYTFGKDGKWPDAQYVKEKVTEICDETGVDIVLSGHDHHYVRTRPLRNGSEDENGTVYVLCGTAGPKRYALREFMVDTFTPTSVIETAIIQNGGYYWNGKDFSSVDDSYEGAVVNSLSVSGSELVFDSYIVDDDTGEAKLSDSFTLTKSSGVTPSASSERNIPYFLSAITSFFRILNYSLFKWLPKFIPLIPKML